jgi:hypothetical protein
MSVVPDAGASATSFPQYAVVVADGLYSASSRSLPADGAKINAAGQLSIISANLRWDPSRNGLFLTNIEVIDDNVTTVFGQPTAVTTFPPRVLPVVYGAAPAVFKSLPGIPDSE